MSQLFNASNTGNIDIPFFSEKETNIMLRHLGLSAHNPAAFHLSAISSWGLYNVSKNKLYFYATGDKLEKPFQASAIYSTYDGIVYAFECHHTQIEERLMNFLIYSISCLDQKAPGQAEPGEEKEG